MTVIPEDHIELSLEASLDQCIKCNICNAACPVSAVTDLFPGPKYVGPQAQRFRMSEQPVPDESVDYCSGCRVCNTVCPTGVRIAELNARARAQIVAERGLSVRNWFLGRSDLTGRLGCGPHAPLANWAARNRPLRLLGEKLLGVHRKAPFPAFSPRSFRSWAGKRTKDQRPKTKDQRPKTKDQSGTNVIGVTTATPGRVERSGAIGDSPLVFGPSSLVTSDTSSSLVTPRQVVYFHGCSTNYYEPFIGKAAVAVLEHNGFEVIIAEQGCCGLPLLSNGDFSAARSYHERNIRLLLPYAEQGIPIVGTSTSCTLTLKEEAPELLGMHSAPARLIAEGTYDIFEFLRNLHIRGELRTDFRPLEQALPYHAPCQLRAHRVGRPALDVLELVPGLHLHESHAACCGLAGTYGFKVEKYQIAMDVGADLFDWVRASGSDTAVCDSEICRWQITHGSGVATRHPIQILAEAYGLPVENS